MAGPDMDVIKEIPGYKVILKAVLKSQIQQLVEQLASHTDEESVILTASVSDGTLSHLGSDSGKFFISDHDEFKSQFLGFCLKRSHEKKREEEREKDEALMMQQLQQSHPHPVGPPMLGAGLMGLTSPHHSQRFPLQLAHRPRFPGNRHQPYVRMGKRQSMPHASKRTSTPKSNTVSIKVEKVDESEATSLNRLSFGNSDQLQENNQSETSSPFKDKSNVPESTDSDTKTAEAASEMLNDIQPSEGLSLESDLSNLMGTTSQPDSEQKETAGVDESETDSSVPIVKVEAITESELELEITGVEPGSSINTSGSLDSSWAHDFSQGQDWADTSASPGNLQGYKIEVNSGLEKTIGQELEIEEDCGDGKNVSVGHSCLCGYKTKDQSNHNKHTGRCCRTAGSSTSMPAMTQNLKPIASMTQELKPPAVMSQGLKTHDAKKQYICDLCGKPYSSKFGLSLHVKSKHENSYKHRCPECGKTFNQTTQYRYHCATHQQIPIDVCPHCKTDFTSHGSLKRHLRICKSNMESFKQYKCDLCTASFSDMSRLSDHQHGKHQPPKHTCNICNKKFCWRSSLKAHRRYCKGQL